MKMKKQMVLVAMSLLLGLALIGGGTFAFFSDSVETNSTFAAGTLDLSANPTTIIDVEDLKPGDSIVKDFELENTGTLDISKVTLDTDYKVIDEEGNNTDDFGEHIEVEFLYNADNLDEVVYETTLAELKDMTPEAISKHIFFPTLGEEGLPSGDEHDFVVKINFVDNGEDQNQFQGDSLELEWTFNAEQQAGEDK